MVGEVGSDILNWHWRPAADTSRQLLEKNSQADVAAYDKVHEQMLAMADMLSSGIKNQFPDKAATR
jgi:hypothetical protein